MDTKEWERYRLEDDEVEEKVEPGKDKFAKKRISEVAEPVDTNTRKMDLYLDSILSRVTGTYEKSQDRITEIKPRVRTKMSKVASTSKGTYKKLEEKGDEFTGKIFQQKLGDTVMNLAVKFPKIIIFIIIILTVIISYFGIAPSEYGGADFREKIHGEFEVYLPQNHETKQILDEINEDYTANLIIVLVQTNNSLDPDDPDFGYADIFDRDILLDFDRIEETKDLDEYKDDNGDIDGVQYMFSISVVIKVINNTPPRFQEAVEDEYGVNNIFRTVQGDYSIPEQGRIDQIEAQLPADSKDSLIRDTNNDGVYDTGYILIGITAETDQEALVATLNNYAESAESCKMTVTGPIPMTIRITGRTYEEFIKVLPAAVILVGSVLVLFHRNFKILLITGLPVMCSLGITYGFLGLAVPILTPQVVLIAPILIALGVAYGLYIANRYSDERSIEDPVERIKKSVGTTGRAVFLSAVTTSIGFSSLIFMEMIPLRVIGIGLSLGIMVCYIITILTVPSLIMALKYEKKAKVKTESKFGNVPIRNRKKIVAVGIVFTLISVGFLGAGMVTANMDFLKMSPQDEEVIVKMREYSDIFGGGQPGMILLDGSPSTGKGRYENVGSMRDYNVLLRMDSLETEINGNPDVKDDEGIENAVALGIVDIMKMLRLPAINISDTIDLPGMGLIEEYFNNYANISFWEVLPLLPPDQQQRLINIFYGSLTLELRSLFVAKDFGSSILIIMMPALDVVTTEKAVNEINAVTDEYNSQPSATHLTGFAAIIVAINNMLVYNSVASTIMALVLVFIILAFIFKSMKFSALTLIPVTLVVIWQPAILVGIGGLGSLINPADPVFTGDLNLFSAIIGSIIVGIGIDFGVHMTERIREQGETVESIKYSVETSGMSFIEATATTLAGLSAVFLILIPAIQEFIILVMLLLICSVLGAILILPAIYTLIFRHKEGKTASIELSEEDVIDSEERLSENAYETIMKRQGTDDSELYGPEPD